TFWQDTNSSTTITKIYQLPEISICLVATHTSIWDLWNLEITLAQHTRMHIVLISGEQCIIMPTSTLFKRIYDTMVHQDSLKNTDGVFSHLFPQDGQSQKKTL